MVNVLQVIGHIGCGGDTTVVLDAMEGIQGSDIHFDFLTHKGAKEDTVERLRSCGSIVYIMDGDVRELGIIKYYYQLLGILRKADTKYDVIHVHTGMQSGVVLRAAKVAGIQNRICHSHVTAIQRPASFLKKAVATPVFHHLYMANSTQRVACSKSAGRFLFGNEAGTTVIYNAVDINPYLSTTDKEVQQFRQEFAIPIECVVVGHIARMCSMKNQQFVVELARRMVNEEKFKFLLVGDGEDFTKIQKLAQGLPNIILVGRRADIPAVMKSCDAVLLPSLPGEGFPMTMIEAQAAGCRCFISSYVTDEVDVGLNLVKSIPLRNTDEWVEMLRRVNRNIDYDFRDTCAEKLLMQGFGKAQFVQKWIKLYA